MTWVVFLQHRVESEEVNGASCGIKVGGAVKSRSLREKKFYSSTQMHESSEQIVTSVRNKP